MECFFPGNGWTPVSSGKWWIDSLFDLTVCVAFAFCIKLFLSQRTKSFLTILLLFFSQSQWALGECTAARGCFWLALSLSTDMPIIFGRKKNYKYVNEKFNIFETESLHVEVNIFCQKLCLVLLCFLIHFYIPVVNKSFSKTCLNSLHKTLKTKTNNCSLNDERVYVHVCFPILMQSNVFFHNLSTYKKTFWNVFIWFNLSRTIQHLK